MVGIHILLSVHIMDVFVLIYELVAGNEVNLWRGAKTCVFISVTWEEDYSHPSTVFSSVHTVCNLFFCFLQT